MFSGRRSSSQGNNASFMVVVSENKATCSISQGNEASFLVVVQENKATWLVFRIFLNISRQHVGEIKATWNQSTRQRVRVGNFQGHRSTDQGTKACNLRSSFIKLMQHVRGIKDTWHVFRSSFEQPKQQCKFYGRRKRKQGNMFPQPRQRGQFPGRRSRKQGDMASFQDFLKHIKATCWRNQGNMELVNKATCSGRQLSRPSFDRCRHQGL